MVRMRRRRVELHRSKDGGRVCCHRARDIGTFAVQEHGYVRRNQLPDGRERFPASRAILFPECCIWLVTTCNVCGCRNQDSAEVDRTIKASAYRLRLGIHSNARKEVAGEDV